MTSDAATYDRVGLAERERVLALLRARETDLRALGVTRLRLYGSMARGEAGPESDVDLMAELDHSAKFSLIDHVGLSTSSATFWAVASTSRPLLGKCGCGCTARRPGCDRGLLMSIGDLAARLDDILAAIRKIETFAAGKAFDDYMADVMLRRAVERNVEIISEASRYI